VKSGRSGLEITLLGAGKPVAVVEARSFKKSAELTSTATNADPAVSQPRSDGPTPPIKVAQGPGPVPTPVPPGAAPFPVPQVGSSPAPMLIPAISAGSPTSSPPVPSSSPTVPPAR
jgi:hypothetical protein